MGELIHRGAQRLETERLILRAFVEEDAPAMYRNWASSDEVTRYLTWPTHESESVTACLTAMWAKEAEQPNRYTWAIVLKELGEPIGSISVVNYDENIASAEIGYCIGQNWWGQGVTAEALKAVIRYLTGTVGIHRVEAKHDVSNPNSGRVMAKAGMRFEGIARAGGRNNQGIVDTAIYAILAEEVPEVQQAAAATTGD